MLCKRIVSIPRRLQGTFWLLPSSGRTQLVLFEIGQAATRRHIVYTCGSKGAISAHGDILYIINLSDEIQRPISLPAIIMEDNNPTVQLSSALSIS